MTGPPGQTANGKRKAVKPRRANASRSLALERFCLRPLGFCLKSLAVILPLIVLGFGLLYLKLLNGPISVGFLVKPTAQALNAELPGLAVAIDDTVMQLSPRGGLEFRLKGVRLSDSQNRLIAVAAFAAIEISPKALARGRVASQRVDLIEPRFLLTRDEQGRLAFNTDEAAVASATALPQPRRYGANPDLPAEPHTSLSAAQSESGMSPSPTQTSADGAKRMEVMRALADMIARLRKEGEASSFLETIGFQKAAIIIDSPRGKNVWRVDDLTVDLSHRQKRSVITSSARIVSNGQPWTVKIKAEEAEKAKSLKIEMEFDELVPRNIGRELPAFAALGGLDIPLSGKATASLDDAQGLHRVEIESSIGAGNLYLAGLNGVPMAIDRGKLILRSDGDGIIEIAPLTIESGQSRISVTGKVTGDPLKSQDWSFDLASVDGLLVPIDGSQPMQIDSLVVSGQVAQQQGLLDLKQLALKIAGAELNVSGQIGSEVQLEGRISPMPLTTLKALWPVSLAPRARAFAVERITKGQLRSGTFRIGAPGHADPAARQPRDRQLSLTLEAADIEVELRKELPAVELPRVLLRVEGDSVELTVPDATMTAAPNRRVTLKGGRMTIAEFDKPRPIAEVSARIQGPLPAVLDILDREPVALLKGNNVTIPLSHIDGKADMQFRVTLPLDDTITLADVRFDGKGRITDGRVKDVFGTHDINGATINVTASDKGFEVRGDMLLAGIAAKLSGQWQPGVTDTKHPPMRLATRLDNADRNLLGLDLDNLVQGEVPLEITIQRGKGDEPVLHVAGDLTPAELMLDELHWKKPVGVPARVEFNVGKGRNGKGLELQNFKVSGENIAIDGWIGIGPDNKAREYYFPDFSLNVVTNLQVQGTLRPDRVWEVKAEGKTFDGRDLFRSLFAFNNDRPKPVRKDKPGIDMHAKIDNVLGANDTSLRQVDIRMSKRAELISGLEMRGVMEGGVPLTANLRPEPGRQRLVVVETTNAGQALKMIGFYPNMVGGKGNLKLNLEGRGAVEKAGSIHIQNFKVLGDPIISEVFQNADESRPQESRPAIAAGTTRRRIVREQIDFQSLDATFSVGNAQVVIEHGDARGPLVGASVRGKLDFKSQRMQLGGTYTPLSGLNRIVGQIPIVSQILTGPRGEGMVGITYLIEGPMTEPQVIVNPLSPLAVGILRELFQIAPENSKVTPRTEPSPQVGIPKVQSSPPSASRKSAAPPPTTEPAVLDAWSTTSKGGRGEAKR